MAWPPNASRASKRRNDGATLSRGMKVQALAAVLLFAACNGPALAPTPGAIGFDEALTGWRVDSTGGRGPHATWTARADRDAISPQQVMALTVVNHVDEDRFNVNWTPQPGFQDGRIAVAVRADEGVVDQGGGPMWRVQDANNYYVCRWNPLESNYRVYVVKDGVRRQLATAMVEGAPRTWHRLEAEHAGDRIVCWFDGKKLLETSDGTIPAAGGIGLWTKADARTSFDDLYVLPAHKK
jgi:hypothetical protein